MAVDDLAWCARLEGVDLREREHDVQRSASDGDEGAAGDAAHDRTRIARESRGALERAEHGELDARVIDDDLNSAHEASALAEDYLARARDAGRPLVS